MPSAICVRWAIQHLLQVGYSTGGRFKVLQHTKRRGYERARTSERERERDREGGSARELVGVDAVCDLLQVGYIIL